MRPTDYFSKLRFTHSGQRLVSFFGGQRSAKA